MPRSRPKGLAHGFGRVAKRAGLVLLGIALSVGLLEVGLRVAATLVSGRPIGGTTANRLRVLSVGDSHTYGIGVAAEGAYPHQLEQILNGGVDPRYEVLNLGLPGMNTPEILSMMPEWLATYEPNFVVLCAGVNNVWNTSQTADDKSMPLWSRLRLARLTSLLRYRFDRQESQPQPRPALERAVTGTSVELRDRRTGRLLARHIGDVRAHTLGTREARLLMRRDIEAIASQVSAVGATLILLTYAATPANEASPRFSTHAALSEEMTRLGARHSLPIVDPRPAFRAHLSRSASARDILFLSEKDDHPNRSGYRLIAGLVAQEIERLASEGSDGEAP